MSYSIFIIKQILLLKDFGFFSTTFIYIYIYVTLDSLAMIRLIISNEAWLKVFLIKVITL